MAQGNAVFLEYAENETGAVRTLGKAGASPDIRVTYELLDDIEHITKVIEGCIPKFEKNMIFPLDKFK